MTTQVFKTRSKIVKAVAAAVLLAAGTTTFADTNNNFALETQQVIEVNQNKLMSSLNAAIGDATGVENVPSHVSFSAEHGATIAHQGQFAVAELQAETIEVDMASLFNELSAALPVPAIESKVLTAESQSEYVSILPSIANIGAEYQENMERALQTVALQTIDYAFSISFAETAEHLE